MKWVVDEKAHWWKDKLMKWPNLKNQQKFKLIGMQVDEMARWGDQAPSFGDIAIWWNGTLMNKIVDEMSGWWKGTLMKWQVDEMIQPKKLTKIWAN